MSKIYDNWERLVAAVLKKEEIWELCHAPSRSSNFSSISSEVEESAYRSESEWVEEYEVGVYLTLAVSMDGSIKVTHARFSRRKFKEQEVETWWLNNRENVYKKYNDHLGLAQFRQSSNSKVEFLGNGEENKNPKRNEHALPKHDFEKKVTSENSKVGGSGGQFVDQWSEQYEPGVYVTLGAFRDGTGDVVRVRFSRRRFKEHQAHAWWLKNRDKVYEKYNIQAGVVRNTMSAVLKETKMYKLVFFKGAKVKFDLEDVLGASAEVLGKGTFGTSYKAILENGVTVMVKRLKEVIVPEREFKQHIEIIGRISGHINIGRLRAYLYSEEEKLLVYDYYHWKSLSAMLHANKGSNRKILDIKTRLKIAVGAARGIAHIHRQGGGNLVHGNIRSSNIFLNERHDARVADIGLARLSSSSTLSVIRNAGYCAPEVISIKKMSQASDVYSFGVVLLELVFGKLPIPITENGDTTDEVFDIELLRYEDDFEKMEHLLQLGIDCVVSDPEKRPKLDDVVRKIEDIRMMTRSVFPTTP